MNEAELLELTPEEIGAAIRLRRARIVLARQSAAECNEFVLRDDETGRPIANAPMHTDWHEQLDANRKVAIFAHIESAKTNQISIGRVLFELGKNPNLRIAICSETDQKAIKLIGAIKNYIETSRELHAVFPKLVRSPRPSDPWTGHALTVQRTTRAKDPSIQAFGCGSSPVGSRIDLLIMDDVLSHRNARTKEQRDKLRRWYRSNLRGRMTTGSRQWIVNTAWHPEDLAHELAEQKGWVKLRYPVMNDNGEPTWPERWSLARIAEAIEELGPVESKRQLYCLGVADSEDRFKEEWIFRCLANGEGLECVDALLPEELPPGAFTVTGVDLATKKKREGALTTFVTVLAYPDGSRQILKIEAGRWSGPDIARIAAETHLRYGSILVVEDNGAQQYMIDQLAVLSEAGPVAIPVVPHTTGSNKHHPIYGVEGLGAEMSAGKWIYPSERRGETFIAASPEIAALIAEQRAYSPVSHTGDRLMAKWFAREYIRKRTMGLRGSVNVNVLEPDKPDVEEADRFVRTI